MRARRVERSSELAEHNFYRLAHLCESALARREPRFAAPSRSLVTFLSRFQRPPRTGLARSRHLSVLNPSESSSAGTPSERRSPESARTDHTCTPGTRHRPPNRWPLPGVNLDRQPRHHCSLREPLGSAFLGSFWPRSPCATADRRTRCGGAPLIDSTRCGRESASLLLRRGSPQARRSHRPAVN